MFNILDTQASFRLKHMQPAIAVSAASLFIHPGMHVCVCPILIEEEGVGGGGGYSNDKVNQSY